MGFGVWGLGLRVLGLGVQGLGFGVTGPKGLLGGSWYRKNTNKDCTDNPLRSPLSALTWLKVPETLNTKPYTLSHKCQEPPSSGHPSPIVFFVQKYRAYGSIHGSGAEDERVADLHCLGPSVGGLG